MAEVLQKRQAYREHLRQQQLQQHFLKQRHLLTAPPSLQARQHLIEALSGIKETIEKEENFETKQYLQLYRSISEKYEISETLLSQLLFTYKLPAVSMGLLPLQCTWAQVFVFLTQTERDPFVRAQLVKILTINTYQLRIIPEKKMRGAIPIIKETLEKTPFEWCQDRSLWVEFCFLFAELLVVAQLLGVQQQFLRIQNGVVKYLEVMTNDRQFRSSIEGRQILIEVSLFVLTLLHKSNNTARCHSLPNNLLEILVENMECSQFDFHRNCQYLRRFFLAGGPYSLEFASVIGDYLPRALHCKSSKYFELLNTMMVLNHLKMDPIFIGKISSFIFAPSSFKSEEVELVQMKKWMMLLLKRQLQKSGGQSPAEQWGIVLNHCMDNIQLLPKVLLQVKECNEATYSLMVELLAKLLVPLYSTQELPLNLLQLFSVCPELELHFEEVNLCP